MRGKTVFASAATLVFLTGFVFATCSALAIASQTVSVPVALLLSIGLTTLWSLLVWLISPFIMDLVQRFAYKSRDISLDELARERPAVAAFVTQVCQRHGVRVPRLKIIEDQTPQAYCYGSTANSARLVVTRGIFHYLDDEEAKAVYGHELGHIVHRDFIVMTVAATLLSILWNVYVIGKNVKGRKNSRPLYIVALAALAFYWVGQYMLLYLSRAREYYADQFSAEETGNPNALSLALIKIAYGITAQTPTPVSQRLMGGTRALGISDFKSAGTTGAAYRAVSTNASGAAAVGPGGWAPTADGVPRAAGAAMPVTLDGVRRIEKVMLFDLYNPWASVSELGSTHPLTGKRIQALGAQSAALGRPPLLSFERVDAQGRALDMTRMYSTFFFEIAIYFAPFIFGAWFALAAGGLALFGQTTLAAVAAGMIVFGIGLGMTIKGFYRFGSLVNPERTTVIDLMSDPYASPLKGRPVRVGGTVIGRVAAGSYVGEDVTLEDPTGGLMAINYESPFSFIGNWWFAIRRVGKLIQQQVEVVGWFRRGVSQQIDLKEMRTASGETISSYTGFWGKAGGVVVLLIGIVVAGVAGFAAASSAATPAIAGASAEATTDPANGVAPPAAAAVPTTGVAEPIPLAHGTTRPRAAEPRREPVPGARPAHPAAPHHP
ncbi:MAG TPA: M48 family metalloprotease [Polyangiaceae bacterium]|nr:M48 family metalloprotease [Polyangiaceae bacterium]